MTYDPHAILYQLLPCTRGAEQWEEEQRQREEGRMPIGRGVPREGRFALVKGGCRLGGLAALGKSHGEGGHRCPQCVASREGRMLAEKGGLGKAGPHRESPTTPKRAPSPRLAVSLGRSRIGHVCWGRSCDRKKTYLRSPE